MPRPFIAPALRERLAAEAHYRCEYCQTSQLFTAMTMHIEHIIPLVANGATTEDNLCQACSLCNGHKGAQTHAIDPETHERVPLFNPRQQIWSEHFHWSADGLEIVGLTPVGRATVRAVKLNNEQLVRARHYWVEAGWHPPAN